MSNIKLLVLDVDGTLTDGKIYIGNNGEIIKAFNAHDAVGVRKLHNCGIETVIITGRKSKIVDIRAKEMGILELYQGIDEKEKKLEEIVIQKKLNYKDVAYIGDDENDYNAMKKCGFKACPKNAVKKIKEIADYVSPCNCDESAVREIIEKILDR